MPMRSRAGAYEIFTGASLLLPSSMKRERSPSFVQATTVTSPERPKKKRKRRRKSGKAKAESIVPVSEPRPETSKSFSNANGSGEQEHSTSQIAQKASLSDGDF